MARKKDISAITQLKDEELDQLIRKGMEKQQATKKRNAYMAFAPMGYQERWFASTKKMLILLAGNQTGKTTCGAIRTIKACVGYWPFSIGGEAKPEFQDLRGIRCLVAGESYSTSIPSAILPKLKEFISAEMLLGPPKKHGSTGMESVFKFVTGAELHVMSYEQGSDAYEGSLWNHVWLDEPPPETVFNAIRRGTLATNGNIVITATPLKEPWMYDNLCIPALDPRSALYGTADIERCNIHDNCMECNNGALPHREIMAYLETLSPKERAAREKGEFSDLSGLEFTEYNEVIHVVDDFI